MSDNNNQGKKVDFAQVPVKLRSPRGLLSLGLLVLVGIFAFVSLQRSRKGPDPVEAVRSEVSRSSEGSAVRVVRAKRKADQMARDTRGELGGLAVPPPAASAAPARPSGRPPEAGPTFPASVTPQRYRSWEPDWSRVGRLSGPGFVDPWRSSGRRFGRSVRRVVPASTQINAALLTPLDSNSPGGKAPVLAQVSFPVLTRGGAVAIPAGSVLRGHVDSVVAQGRERLGLRWVAISFPGGRELPLDAVGTGPEGRLGLAGKVNHHWGAVYAHALVTSVLGAATQVSQTPETGGLGFTTGATWEQSAAEGAGRGLESATSEIMRRTLDRPSTFRAEAGTRVGALVLRDLEIPR